MAGIELRPERHVGGFHIDHARLRADRLARARAALREHELPAALLFDPFNVRYTTSAGIATVYGLHSAFRWALIPVESEPILWEYPDAPHLFEAGYTGEMRPAPSWAFFGSGTAAAGHARAFAAELLDVLQERGLAGESIGIDRLDATGYMALLETGLRIEDAQPALEQARAVKTVDELEGFRRGAKACDTAIDVLRAAIRPGASELEIWNAFMSEALSQGAEYAESRYLVAGARTNPWMREASDHVVADGDLVAFDTDLVAEDGFLIDVSRTYLCGDTAPTAEQRALYGAAHDFLVTSIPEFRPGRSFRELGETLGPRLPSDFQELRYPFIAHGCGYADEYPAIKFADHHDGCVERNMVISIEAYVGVRGGSCGVKLEQQIIVHDDGPELLSSAPFDDRLLG
jgi:Xaa-Pro dipeptidase